MLNVFMLNVILLGVIHKASLIFSVMPNVLKLTVM
jgi:hypothetical protein